MFSKHDLKEHYCEKRYYSKLNKNVKGNKLLLNPHECENCYLAAGTGFGCEGRYAANGLQAGGSAAAAGWSREDGGLMNSSKRIPVRSIKDQFKHQRKRTSGIPFD